MHRRAIRTLFGFGAGLAILASAFFISEPRKTDFYAAAQEATVLVETPESFGTGLVFQRGGITFFWTAAHVVRSDPHAVKISVQFRVDGIKTCMMEYPALPVAFDYDADLALYWIPEIPEYLVGSVGFSASDARVGSPIFHVGNFLGPNFDGSVTSGIVSQQNVNPELSGWFWVGLTQADFLAMPGGSGGGVFATNSGRVVGILVGGAGGISAYVPVSAIRAWADAQDVEWAVDGDSAPSDGWLRQRAAFISTLPDLTLP